MLPERKTRVLIGRVGASSLVDVRKLTMYQLLGVCHHDRALQMDPASWANDHHKSLADDDYDSNYDNHPELSGYQTLPAQDLKDDSELDAGSSLSPTTPSGAISLSDQMSKLMKEESSPAGKSSTATLATKDTSPSSASPTEKDSSSAAAATAATPVVTGNSASSGTPSGVIEGMKPNARKIIQGKRANRKDLRMLYVALDTI